MLTSTKAAEYATDWANERYHNASGKLEELDLAQGWLAGYYAARLGGIEEQLYLAEQQLLVARKALKEIATWDQALQDTVVAYGSGTGVWLGCVTTANKAIQDMRNLKRK